MLIAIGELWGETEILCAICDKHCLTTQDGNKDLLATKFLIRHFEEVGIEYYQVCKLSPL
jgi:predicted thioesterase